MTLTNRVTIEQVVKGPDDIRRKHLASRESMQKLEPEIDDLGVFAKPKDKTKLAILGSKRSLGTPALIE
jgi:hypothetical protein